ncbi:MAG TPA: DUF4097 family beta strand repeat-containing protein [Chloroflexia bacterium]|nr:DUF4097 family beta strand repeat-containing protein [Chloroflexia bacterium]
MNSTANEPGIRLQLDGEQAASLTIEGISGSLEIHGWEQPFIEVTGEDDDEDDELADLLDVTQQGNDVRINLQPTGRPRRLKNKDENEMSWGEFGRVLRHIGRSVNMDLVVHVPHRCDLTLRTANGDIELSQIRGKVFVQTASGDVNMTEVEGSVLVKSASADVTINRLRGRLGVRSMSGDLEVQESELGALSVGTVSGDLDISAALHPSDEYLIQTVSGDVQLTLPMDIHAMVGLVTVSGEMECELPHQAERQGRRRRQLAVNGGGDVRLQIQTTSGDIQISGDPGLEITGPPPITDTGELDENSIPAETRRFSADESNAAQAAMPGGEHFRAEAGAGGDGEPARTQRLESRKSPEMAILEAIETGAMSVDEGLRRLNELAQ